MDEASLRAETAPLIQRWDAFLGKIEAAMHEALDEAGPALVEVIVDDDGGVIPFLQSVTAVKGQVRILIDKVDPTWRDKVRPQLRAADPGEATWDELAETIKAGTLTDGSSEVLERWELVTCGKAAERLQVVIEEGRRTSFRCSLCSADIEITQNVYRAHYETCPYCSGRSTYEPSNQLRETLWFTADHLARYRCLERYDGLQAAHERYRQERVPIPAPVIDDLREHYMGYYESVLRERIRVVPEFESTFEADLARHRRDFELYERNPETPTD